MVEQSKINIKSLIALSVIGFVIYLVLKYIEGILFSITQIAAIYILRDSKYFDFYEIIPQFILVIFWAILVFKYLDNFSGQINLSDEYPRKYAIRFLIIALILFGISVGLNFLSQHIWSIERPTFTTERLLIAKKDSIISILGVIEILIIVIGYLKIIRKTTAANRR